jgi:lipid II:glycine glycyltransferase (peptidoglycan interpeptide bridge formation enzyme)
MKHKPLKQIMTAALAVIALGMIGSGQTKTKPKWNSYEIRCLDQNKTLFFGIAEYEGKFGVAHLYVGNIKIGKLLATSAGPDVIRVKILGETLNTGFEILKSGTVFAVDYTPTSPTRTEVCRASVKYYN